MTPRLQEKYANEVIQAMTEKFGYKNIMEVPKLEKVTINMGLGEAKENAKIMESAVEEIGLITGQTDSNKSQKVHRKLQSKTGNACWR